MFLIPSRRDASSIGYATFSSSIRHGLGGLPKARPV